MRLRTLLFPALLVGLLTGAARRDPPLRNLRLAATHTLVATAPDTTTMTLTWANPQDDGKGAIDSLKMHVIGIMADTNYVFRAPFPTTLVRKREVPLTAYSNPGLIATGQATFDLLAEATVYRRKGFAGPTRSNTVLVVILDPAPSPVTGLTLSVVKTP
jgi:hypothetical protein